ncbi:lytic polysaccharide monooxygenase [Hypoxylon sp. EC38]|nr:lytic polysaccharide monooxygenase [Hypoxylon sp. EC38]
MPPGAKLQPEDVPTVMVIGEEQTASFLGQAVHGGGSCQFSLSGLISNGSWSDSLSKDLEWKVIHSVEGGCPARNQKGNLDGPNQDKYSFIIPEGIEPGDYVFSWTWFPRIGGQPEIYQNCAPITVTPAKAKRMTNTNRRAFLTKRAEFPELFMANLGEVSGGCTTGKALEKQLAIAFPNPGASVEQPEGSVNLFKQPCDGNPKEKKIQGDDNIGTTNLSIPPQSSSTSAVESNTSNTLLFSTSTTSTPSISYSLSTEMVSSRTSDASTTSSSSPETCIEGHLTCLGDGTHFATCTGGQLTLPQPIAPGFRCKVGFGIGLDISPALKLGVT